MSVKAGEVHDRQLLLEVVTRLGGYVDEEAELLTAWPSAPIDRATFVLRSSRPIGAWRRARLLRSHPEALDGDDLAFLARSDGDPSAPVAAVERLVALLAAAPASAGIRDAAERLAIDRRVRPDVRLAAIWRRRAEDWKTPEYAGPELLQLFRASVTYRNARDFTEPFGWREAGLTHPIERPADAAAA